MYNTHAILHYWPDAQAFNVGHVALKLEKNIACDSVYASPQIIHRPSASPSQDEIFSSSQASISSFIDQQLCVTEQTHAMTQQSFYISWSGMESYSKSVSPEYYGNNVISFSLLLLDCDCDELVQVFYRELAKQPYSLTSHNCAHLIAKLLGSTDESLAKKSKQLLLTPAQITKAVMKSNLRRAESLCESNASCSSIEERINYSIGSLNAWFYSNCYHNFDLFNNFRLTNKFRAASEFIFEINNNYYLYPDNHEILKQQLITHFKAARIRRAFNTDHVQKMCKLLCN